MILSFLLCGYFKYLVIIALILLFHDLGHILVLKRLKYKVYKIEILPFGANIETNMGLNSSSKDIFLVSIAGVLMQIFLYFLFFLIYNFGYMSELFFNIFLKYNTLLIIFNLLPIYPLDGNKIISALLEFFVCFRLTLFFSVIISFLVLIIFGYCNYIFGFDCYPIVFFLLFKIISYIREYRYIWNKFFLERSFKDLEYKKIKNISNVKNIYKNRLNFINGLCERKFYFKK